MLTYLFYFSFLYCCCIYGLLRPGCAWVLDMALVHAGAAVQVRTVMAPPEFERTSTIGHLQREFFDKDIEPEPPVVFKLYYKRRDLFYSCERKNTCGQVRKVRRFGQRQIPMKVSFRRHLRCYNAKLTTKDAFHVY